MQNNLTTQILIENDENIIEDTIKSVLPLDGNILVANVGSTDQTEQICKEYGLKVIRYSLNNDYSSVRNQLTQKGINFYIKPGEQLVAGVDEIKNAKQTSYVKVINDNLISKSIRIWKENKFVNPVFETIYDNNADELEVIIHQKKQGSFEKYPALIEHWKKIKPTSPDPFYYQSCLLLGSGKIDEFIPVAKHYLFHNRPGMSTTMTRYHLSLIQMNKGQLKEALKNVLECIKLNPLMAEFWCLLGDIYYRAKGYKKSKHFYQNAIILGKCRLKKDLWPLEVTKYKEYPEKMIRNCNDLIENTKYLHGR